MPANRLFEINTIFDGLMFLTICIAPQTPKIVHVREQQGPQIAILTQFLPDYQYFDSKLITRLLIINNNSSTLIIF